jgi:hypothetical protein
MKYRLTALIVVLSLALASCSLAEDITPPPGYQSPTSAEYPIPVTQTSQATRTTEPATITPETSTGSAKSTTPSTDITQTPGASLGNIIGNLVNGSGGAIPEGQQVSLFGFDMDQSGTYQKVLQITSPVDTQGSYSFKDVEIMPDRAFLVITSFGGIEYQSDPVIVSGANTDYSVPVTIYEKTDDFSLITFSQVHLIFDLSSQNVIQVTELFIATNPSKQAVAVTSDGTTIPFIQTPENASDLQFQLSQGSSQLLNATDGFAMLPGADKQYGFISNYTLPYNKSLKFAQPFSLPVSSLTVFLPTGMRLRGEQLTDAGSQDIQGTTYQLYQVNQMASGSSLAFTLSGKPGASTGGTSSRQTMILIGIGIVGVLLIGLGIYLYLRDRARFKRENEIKEAVIEKDALGEDRDSIMDAMIALDDQYKAGEIPKEAYEERRKELKERLKSVL